MKQLPDKSIDLAIIDPPYGLNQDLTKVKSRSRLAASTIMQDFDWDKERPSQEYFNELFRVSKHQIIWGGNYFTDMIGRPSSGWIVWDKVNGNSNYSDVELAWTSFNKGARLFRYMWNGMLQGKSITEGHLMQGDKSKNEKRIHPTQKPVILYKWTLTKYAKRVWVILDTHHGSGSLGIACMEMGFDYLAIEKNKNHFNDAEVRRKNYLSQFKIKL